MENTIEEIKIRRKKLGLTQTELAKLSGVSQSLIAKIESNKIDPTFSKTKKIFLALNSIQKKTSLKAKDIMNKKIISLKPEAYLKEAIDKMRSHGISQIPIIDKEIIGLVSESSILEQIQEGKDIKELKIKDVISETPPMVSEETDIELITQMLKYNPMILINKYGKITGIITKADILKKVYK